LEEMKGECVPEFPSKYFFGESGLYLTVYVDDFTLSRPADAHSAFWKKLKGFVDLREITGLESAG
jgi:hypothetical protein